MSRFSCFFQLRCFGVTALKEGHQSPEIGGLGIDWVAVESRKNTEIDHLVSMGFDRSRVLAAVHVGGIVERFKKMFGKLGDDDDNQLTVLGDSINDYYSQHQIGYRHIDCAQAYEKEEM